MARKAIINLRNIKFQKLLTTILKDVLRMHMDEF